MSDEIETGPDGLEQDLASAIRESLPLIRQLNTRDVLAQNDAGLPEPSAAPCVRVSVW